MEELERGITQNGALCAVIGADGQPTGELIRIPAKTRWVHAPWPWSPHPALNWPDSVQHAPQPRTQIVFVRDPDKPGTCAKWGYPSYGTNERVWSYRLVRVTSAGMEILWATDSSAGPSWQQILAMSARWPRLANGSDELSRIYRRAAQIRPAIGLMFQVFFEGEWHPSAIDIRAPIGEVPPDLLR